MQEGCGIVTVTEPSAALCGIHKSGFQMHYHAQLRQTYKCKYRVQECVVQRARRSVYIVQVVQELNK